MTDSPRIDELRRRVQADPTSIAFAALAEEYRRAGYFAQAVEVCRTGLTRHPAYISARVTLGRALLELNQFDEAKMELDQVLSIAPENLAAIRALAELHERTGEPGPPAAEMKPLPAPAPASSIDAFELDLMPPMPARVVPFPADAAAAATVPAPTPVLATATLEQFERGEPGPPAVPAPAHPQPEPAYVEPQWEYAHIEAPPERAPFEEQPQPAQIEAQREPAEPQHDAALEHLERLLKAILELKAAG